MTKTFTFDAHQLITWISAITKDLRQFHLFTAIPKLKDGRHLKNINWRFFGFNDETTTKSVDFAQIRKTN